MPLESYVWFVLELSEQVVLGEFAARGVVVVIVVVISAWS